MTSSDTSNYFRSAIVESAPIALPLKTSNEAFVLGGLFAQKLGCQVKDMACMRSKSASQVVNATEASKKSVASLKILEMFEQYGPVIDGGLVKGQILDLFSKDMFARKPLIIGTTTEETILYVYGNWKQPVPAQSYIALLAAFNPTHSIQIGEHYPPQLFPADQREMISHLGTDFIFTCPNRNLSRTILEMTQAKNIWMYVWNHADSFPGWGRVHFCEGRVCHGSEIPFVFNTAYKENFTFTADEKILSDDVMAYWTNFAWTGDPNQSGASFRKSQRSKSGRQVLGKTRILADWSVYNDDNKWGSIMFKTPANEMVSQYMANFCDFWDGISYTKI